MEYTNKKIRLNIWDDGDSSVGISGEVNTTLDLVCYGCMSEDSLENLTKDPEFRKLLQKHFTVDFKVKVMSDEEIEGDDA